MSKTVHYKHPVLGYHACGMGDRRLVLLSSSLSQVTCKRCLTTVTAKRRKKGDS